MNVQTLNEHGDGVHIKWTTELAPMKVRCATVGKLLTQQPKGNYGRRQKDVKTDRPAH